MLTSNFDKIHILKTLFSVYHRKEIRTEIFKLYFEMLLKISYLKDYFY